MNEKIKILEDGQKKYNEEEINKLKNEFNKERENYELIIKVKDEEIEKLLKNKDTAKNQEGKNMKQWYTNMNK